MRKRFHVIKNLFEVEVKFTNLFAPRLGAPPFPYNYLERTLLQVLFLSRLIREVVPYSTTAGVLLRCKKLITIMTVKFCM